MESASLRTASPLISDDSPREREIVQAYGSLQDLPGWAAAKQSFGSGIFGRPAQGRYYTEGQLWL